jgi:hypothetical protein
VQHCFVATALRPRWVRPGHAGTSLPCPMSTYRKRLSSAASGASVEDHFRASNRARCAACVRPGRSTDPREPVPRLVVSSFYQPVDFFLAQSALPPELPKTGNISHEAEKTPQAQGAPAGTCSPPRGLFFWYRGTYARHHRIQGPNTRRAGHRTQGTAPQVVPNTGQFRCFWNDTPVSQDEYPRYFRKEDRTVLWPG